MQLNIVQSLDNIEVHRKGCVHESDRMPNYGVVTLEADSKEQAIRRYYIGINFDAVTTEAEPHGFAEKMGWKFAPCARTLPRESPDPGTHVDDVLAVVDPEKPDMSDTDGAVHAEIKVGGHSTIFLKQGRKDYIIVRHRQGAEAVRVAHGTQPAMLAALPAIITQEVTNG